MASVKRVEYKSGRVVYRIVICQGYDKKILHTNGLRVLKITLLMVPMQDINRFWKAE